MSDASRPEGRNGTSRSYDETIVGLTFYTDDPSEPVAEFGEQARLPIPEVGETVGFDDRQLEAARRASIGPGTTERRYRVVDREFEYRRLDYDGFSGEDRRQVVVFVTLEVEPIRAE